MIANLVADEYARKICTVRLAAARTGRPYHTEDTGFRIPLSSLLWFRANIKTHRIMLYSSTT